MNDNDQIKKDHPFSYKGIMHAYDAKEIGESIPFWVSIALAVTTLVITWLSSKSFYEILIFWTEQIMAVFPNLLGFNLGGYALIVGFGNGSLLKAMTRKNAGKKSTIFQKLSGVFAFSILLQLAAFIAAFLITFLNKFEFKSNSQITVDSVNALLVFILSFLGFWGLLIIPNLVSNVFTFGQMHHSLLTIERIKSERRNRERDNT
ncbi:hypothetical protein [Spirosoma spitsbergense]|uniref:hypothetical protein n=1 Tax=Spirosoma spitsbergense TaxID=431554 RepID=UPI00035DB1C5|nr:hypothetical protein [Spirosoma spitsbergense]